MFKKFIITAIAAIAMMVGLQAPASAAMAVAKPAAKTETASAVAKVGFRRGGRGFRRFRRFGWKRYHWHHGHRYYGGKWAAYRRCKWKQRRGYRIYCPYPIYY